MTEQLARDADGDASDARAALAARVRGFCAAFNRDDLDAVMACFAEDAVYETLEGRSHRGRAAIRAALEPQFRGAFGRLRFREEDLILEPATGKAVLRWVCQHSREGAPVAQALARLRRAAFGAALGSRFGWQGLDVLYFAGPLIVAKYTFGRTRLPLLRSGLAPSPPPRGATGR